MSTRKRLFCNQMIAKGHKERRMGGARALVLPGIVLVVLSLSCVCSAVAPQNAKVNTQASDARLALRASQNASVMAPYHALEDWALQRGSLFGSAFVDQVPDSSSVALRLSRSVALRTAAACIPQSLVISAHVVQSSPIGRVVSKERPELGFVLWVLYEESLGEGSEWHEYLRTWPSTPDVPAYWTSAQRDLLRHTRASRIISAEKSAEKRLWIRAQELQQEHSSVLDVDVITRERFKWAYYSCRSRLFPLEDGVVLLPILDLIVPQNVHQRLYDGNADVHVLADQDNVVCVVPQQQLSAGQMVWKSLESDNSHLIAVHGIADQYNQLDFIMAQTSLDTADVDFDKKKELLQWGAHLLQDEYMNAEEHEVTLRMTASSQLAALFFWTRLNRMSTRLVNSDRGQKVVNCMRGLGDSVEKIRTSCGIPLGLEAAVAQEVGLWIANQINRFSTSLEEDEEALAEQLEKGSDADTRVIAALHVLIAEKRMYNKWFIKVDSHLGAVKEAKQRLHELKSNPKDEL